MQNSEWGKCTLEICTVVICLSSCVRLFISQEITAEHAPGSCVWLYNFLDGCARWLLMGENESNYVAFQSSFWIESNHPSQISKHLTFYLKSKHCIDVQMLKQLCIEYCLSTYSPYVLLVLICWLGQKNHNVQPIMGELKTPEHVCTQAWTVTSVIM